MNNLEKKLGLGVIALLFLGLAAPSGKAASAPWIFPAADVGAVAMPPRAAQPTAPPPSAFRAPGLQAVHALQLGPNLAKATGQALHPGGPEWVATVREAPASFPVSAWHPLDGGFIARFVASAEGAHGLRVRLDLGVLPGSMELRAAGEDGRISAMVLDPALGPQAWTPWTDGPVQVVELFSRVLPSDGAVSVGALLNVDVPDFPKAAAACTVSTLCSTGDAVLDGAIAEARRSVMRISFIDGASGFNCTATLINTPKYPAAHVVTAHHCVGSAAVAATITSRFFYETTACGSTDADATWVQVAGGMQLVFTNFNVDSTLLLMNTPPPTAAVYSGYDPTRLAAGAAVVSLSHPRSDPMRMARGIVLGEHRAATADTGQYPQDMYAVRWTTGTTEAGSSGSGLFTLAQGALQLRGVLFGGSEGDACSPDKISLYGRTEVFAPQIDPYVRLASVPADDAPNRVIDFGVPLDPGGAETLNLRATPLAFLGRQVAPAGDVDLYRFALSQPRTVAMWSEGGEDLVGTLLDSRGDGLWANDDAQRGALDFGLTRELQPGTYFLQVAHWEALGTAPYSVRFAAYDVGTNYTDLWWNENESGWGMNINHQGNVLFATLFTYDLDGSPLWLVLANGARQADGSYFGTLYRTTGPPFNAATWTPITAIEVGTMRITFLGLGGATLAYSVNGVQVNRNIARQRFGRAPECSWSVFDRSFATNFQDLWWNPSESGWGLNLTHQGDNLFATLFTYRADGKGLWLVMSNGAQVSPFVYRGTLYRTAGPAFNTSPWTPIVATPVGTMSLDFTDGAGFSGNRGTLTYTVDGVGVTKPIRRQEFAQPRTECRTTSSE
jgi:hypothetical protein